MDFLNNSEAGVVSYLDLLLSPLQSTVAEQ
jgi:hypothetical protein